MDDMKDEKIASYLVMHLNGMAYDVWKGMKNSSKRNEDEMKKCYVPRTAYGNPWRGGL